MAGLNTHHGQMTNTVSSYRTLFGCDYHCITCSTLQDARSAKTVKDIMPLIMDDGQFAKYVKPTITLMQSLLRLLIKRSMRIYITGNVMKKNGSS